MWQSPEFWVAIAFVLFVALTFRTITRRVFAALDARSARIRAEIDDAKALREQAQKLLAESKRKQRDALKEAEAIVEHAKVEAGRLREQAEKDLEAALARREQAAIEKIAQAEAKALKDVHNQAVDVALAAATKLISEHLDKARSEALIDRSIGDISEKLH